MNDPLSTPEMDPFNVLGLQTGCDEAGIRARYLQLVRENPPEKDADAFDRIQRAYKAARDPLFLAKQLVVFEENEPRPWNEIIDEQAARPPRLPVPVLLSLGNFSVNTKDDENE